MPWWMPSRPWTRGRSASSLSTRPARDGYVEPSELGEAATAGLSQTKSINAGQGLWNGSRLITPKGGPPEAVARRNRYPHARPSRVCARRGSLCVHGAVSRHRERRFQPARRSHRTVTEGMLPPWRSRSAPRLRSSSSANQRRRDRAASDFRGEEERGAALLPSSPSPCHTVSCARSATSCGSSTDELCSCPPSPTSPFALLRPPSRRPRSTPAAQRLLAARRGLACLRCFRRGEGPRAVRGTFIIDKEGVVSLDRRERPAGRPRPSTSRRSTPQTRHGESPRAGTVLDRTLIDANYYLPPYRP